MAMTENYRLLPVSLEMQGEPSIEEWTNLGKTLGTMRGASPFWIGDWLTYGEKKYGETYTQAMEVTGYKYQTLVSAKYVSSKVPPENRMLDVSFSHHRAVANVPPEEQRNMLQASKDNKMNVSQLKKYIKERVVPEPETGRLCKVCRTRVESFKYMVVCLPCHDKIEAT